MSCEEIKFSCGGLVCWIWMFWDQSMRGSMSGFVKCLILGRACSLPWVASSLAMLSTYSFSGMFE